MVQQLEKQCKIRREKKLLIDKRVSIMANFLLELAQKEHPLHLRL